MAMKTLRYLDRSIIGRTLLFDDQPIAIADDIDVPGFNPDTLVYCYWDEEKLMRGERRFLGIEITNIDTLTERDFAALDRLDLPRIDSEQVGLHDVTIPDLLRWAQDRYRAEAASYARVKVG